MQLQVVVGVHLQVMSHCREAHCFMCGTVPVLPCACSRVFLCIWGAVEGVAAPARSEP